MPPNINYLFICFDLGTPYQKRKTNITEVFVVNGSFVKMAKCERTTQQKKRCSWFKTKCGCVFFSCLPIMKKTQHIYIYNVCKINLKDTTTQAIYLCDSCHFIKRLAYGCFFCYMLLYSFYFCVEPISNTHNKKKMEKRIRLFAFHVTPINLLVYNNMIYE